MTGPLLASYVVLWVLVIVETIALFALYQHFGEMYLNSREGRTNQGPKMGSKLKTIEAQDIADSRVDLSAVGEPKLMIFASTNCTVCDELQADLKKFASAHPEIRTLVVCAGDKKSVSRWADGLIEVARIVADPGYRLAKRYGVGVTPFLIGTDASGTVRTKGVVNDLQGLEFHAEQISLPQESKLD